LLVGFYGTTIKRGCDPYVRGQISLLKCGKKVNGMANGKWQTASCKRQKAGGAIKLLEMKLSDRKRDGGPWKRVGPPKSVALSAEGVLALIKRYLLAGKSVGARTTH